MTPADRRRVRRLRLAGQLLVPRARRTPPEVVRHLGAAQAQEASSGLWSVGLRARVTASEVEAAVAERQIVRTWPMRGTLHYVSAEDARWMCQLFAGPAVRAARSRHAQLGLTAEVVGSARDVVTAVLGDGPCFRPALYATLRHAGIDPEGQRGISLLGLFCQEGLLCQATPEGRQPTFALIDQWVPHSRQPSRDEGLATAVGRYVRSHGPVTEADAAGWLSAPRGLVREALGLLGDAVVRDRIGDTAYLTHRDAAPPAPGGSVHLLPMWDEYHLGYKDRSAAMTPEVARRAVPGSNGLFQATVLVDGEVVGIWRRRQTRSAVTVTVDALAPLNATARRRLERAVSAYGTFLGVPATLGEPRTSAPLRGAPSAL